jgi:hypothetical protein
MERQQSEYESESYYDEEDDEREKEPVPPLKRQAGIPPLK